MELTLFGTAAASYAAATLLSFVYLYSRDERWSSWMLRLLRFGAAAHLCSFGLRARHFWAVPGNCYFMPINSFFGALSYLSLAVAAVFALVEGRHRLGILGAFVLPWASLAAAGAWGRARAVGSTELSALAPALRSYWINIHPVVLMASYAVFANAFGVALALLIQERQIKSRKPTELCYRLPAIEDLDSLHCRLVMAGLPVLAAGIILGGLWAHAAWGRFWNWDAKETWALVTALVYAAYLRLRLLSGWRGRRALYVSMLGFACIVFTFFFVNYMSGLHGYLSKG